MCFSDSTGSKEAACCSAWETSAHVSPIRISFLSPLAVFFFFFFFHCSARSEARARGRYQLDGMGYKRQEMLPYPLIVCLPVSMMRV